MNGIELKKKRKDIGLTRVALAKLLGVSKTTIYNYENGGKIPDTKIPLFNEVFNRYGIGELPLLNEKPIQYKGEGKVLDENNMPTKTVTIIPIKGRGGLENAYYDKLFMDKLKKEVRVVRQKSSEGSEWFKIEVEGISMDDSTSDFEGSKYSLCEGDWTYCRSIPKIHWRNKLHFNNVKVFCFFHNTRGIIFKKIKDHNLENGELSLCSLNKDKKKFPDFTINVSECSYILNVIEVLTKF